MTDKPETRSSQANRLMWSLLADLSRQINWYGETLNKEDWKIMVTAALKRQRAVKGIEGGFVVLGEPTRNMTIGQMNELIEFVVMFGTVQNVKFSAPEYRQEEVAA